VSVGANCTPGGMAGNPRPRPRRGRAGLLALALAGSAAGGKAQDLAPDPKAEIAAWEQAQRRAHEEAVEKALDAYKAAIRAAKTPSERATAVWQLGDAERDPKILAELARVAREPGLVRQEAVAALGKYRGEKAAAQALVGALTASLSRGETDMAERCLAALAGVAHESGIPAVARLVADKNANVAAGAIRVLGETDAPAAIPPLLAVWEELDRDAQRSGDSKKQAEDRLKVVEKPLREALAKRTGESLAGPAEYRAWWLRNRASIKPRDDPPPPICPHLAPVAWVSPEGLVGYWPFDDGKGNPSAADCSGNGLHASYAGAPSSTTQVPPPLAAFSSHGLRLNGSTDWVAVPDAPALRLPGDMTIAFWFRKEGEASDWVRLVGKGGEKIRSFGVFLEKAPASRLKFQQYDGEGKNILDFDCRAAMRPGTWTHVAAVVKGDRGFLYVNGALEGAKDRTGAAAATADPLTIGYGGFHKHFNGLVDDVRLYARALDAAEVASLARGLRAAPAAMAGIAARPPEPSPGAVPVPIDLAGLVSDTTPVRYAWGVVQTGALMYVDRDYPYLDVGTCGGLPCLRTACDDKKSKGDAFITFNLKRDATILVGLDARVPRPAWMSGFTDTGEEIGGRHKEGRRPYRLWARDASAGRVALGGLDTNHAMYVVILRPKEGATLVAGETSTPAGLDRPAGLFQRAVNLNGPELIVDGNRWEAGPVAENCLVFGAPADDRDAAPDPAVDPVFARMLQTGYHGANKVRILLGGVGPGTCRIYLYVRDARQRFGVWVAGQQVERGLDCAGRGAWRRLGPWEAEPAGGVLDVRVSGQEVTVCGIEVWR